MTIKPITNKEIMGTFNNKLLLGLTHMPIVKANHIPAAKKEKRVPKKILTKVSSRFSAFWRFKSLESKSAWSALFIFILAHVEISKKSIAQNCKKGRLKMLTLFSLQKTLLLKVINNKPNSFEKHKNILTPGLTIFLGRQTVIQLGQACRRCVPGFVKKTQSRIRPTLKAFFGLGGGF